MLNSLRVFELQEFLVEARLPRAGRKPELVHRALSAAQSDPRLTAKVIQLYEAKTGPYYPHAHGYHVRSAPYDKPTGARMAMPVTSTVHGHGQATKRALVPVDVKFCPLALYDNVDTIIRPSYLS